MAIIESFFKWSLIAIVGMMAVTAIGGALMGAMEGVMSTPGFFVLLVLATLVLMAAGAAVVGVGGLWFWRWWQHSRIDVDRRAEFVAPDEHGRLPVPASLLRTPVGAQVALAQNVASFTSNLTHYHNAPSWSNSSNLTGADGVAMASAIATPGTFWQLYQSGALPERGFLMGYSLDEDGEAITADWRDLYSALIGGKSGMGKSTLIRSILAQSALQGGRFVVIDPHYGAGEESLGASLQPLRNLMLCDIAADERQMIDALFFVGQIGARRLAGQDRDRWPLVLVVDETTALFQRSAVADELTRTLGQISQETRKVGVYALCIGQNFDGRIMDTTIRNSFVSMISMPARRDVARVQSGNAQFGQMAETLKLGQCVWMTPTGDLHRLAVPNCTAADLELVAQAFSGQNTHGTVNPLLPKVEASSTASSVASSDTLSDTYLERHFPNARTGKKSATELATELATEDQAQRAITMFLDGSTLNEIISEVWGATSGDKKIRAGVELQRILRTYMKQNRG